MASEPRRCDQLPVLARVGLDDAEHTEALGVALGAALAEAAAAGHVVALVGEMGMGKTCLTRGVARGLAVEDPEAVASPTYLLVVEHPGPLPMVHMDAWLPEKTRGFLLDGGMDYLAEQSGVVVVEWADRLEDLLPDGPETVWVVLEPAEDGGRWATLRCALPAAEPWRRAVAAFARQ